MTEPADERVDAAARAHDAAPELVPVDVDGVFAVAVGTVLWGVAFVVLLAFNGRLRDDGRLWWLATCGIGFLVGLLGLWYVRRRRDAIRRSR